MSDGHESGLSRWSRRKSRARSRGRGAALPEATAAVATPEQTAPIEAEEISAVGPAVPAEKASTAPDEAKLASQSDAQPDLPPIEELDYDSDYAQFLSPKVSDGVRKMALRRLWRSNPVLANVDGLVDYDDDFTDAATVIEGLKSVYQVGRGMLVDEDKSGADGTSVADATPHQEARDVDGETESDADMPPSEEQDAATDTSPQVGTAVDSPPAKTVKKAKDSGDRQV